MDSSNVESGSVGFSSADGFHGDGSVVLSVQFDKAHMLAADGDMKTSTPNRGGTKQSRHDMSLSMYASSRENVSVDPLMLSTSMTTAGIYYGEDEETASTTLGLDAMSDSPQSQTLQDTSDSSSPAVSPPRFEHRNLQQSCPVDPETVPVIRVEDEPSTLYPEDIQVPIVGYEVMEERAKFTVFKIQVQKTESESWFVFRRYSDFCHLNEQLTFMFPGIRLSLPPKRWFRNNYQRDFLDDRLSGLQAFLNNVTGHGDICNSKPVREFFCFDDPPGPHDSLEESRALCDTLEETAYNLQHQNAEKDREIALLKEELELFRSQVTMLSKRLREMTAGSRDTSSVTSPMSNELSVAECDMEVSLEPEADQSHNVSDGDGMIGTRHGSSTPLPGKDRPSPGKKLKLSLIVPVEVHSETGEENT